MCMYLTPNLFFQSIMGICMHTHAPIDSSMVQNDKEPDKGEDLINNKRERFLPTCTPHTHAHTRAHANVHQQCHNHTRRAGTTAATTFTDATLAAACMPDHSS